MATKKLQGITIEIDGNTTKLSDSLKNVNKTIASTSSELKNINSLLKLDPTNTVLLSQKQQVLADTIKTTVEKLKQLQEAKRQADEQVASGKMDKSSKEYRELEREIIATTNKLSALEGQLADTNDDLEKSTKDVKELSDAENEASGNTSRFGDVMKANLASDMIQKGLSITKELIEAIAKQVYELGKQSIESFAEYEQLVGGIESMFGKAQNSTDLIAKVTETGSEAWKNLGLSYNGYYSTFMKTYPLIKTSIEDENQAIDTTNRMLQLESDLANTFGYDMETAATAVNWALKGSFNYIDNLNIGIKGTKEGFLAAAQSAGYMVKSVDELSGDQILDVLEKFADKYGVLGKTAEEASTTISGSVKSMKAAWENMLVGVADDESQFGDLVNNLVESIGTAAENLLPRIAQIFTGLSQMVIQLLPILLPQAVEAATQLFEGIGKSLEENSGLLVEAIVSSITSMIQMATKLYPKFLKIGLEILKSIIQGLIKELPSLIESMVELITTMQVTIHGMLGDILALGIELLVALIQGFAKALPILIEFIPEIITAVVDTLVKPELLVLLINAGIEIIFALIDGLMQCLPTLLKTASYFPGMIGKTIWDNLSNADWKGMGKSMLDGIIKGFTNFGSSIGNAAKKLVNTLVGDVKKLFGIHSPSKVMADEIGQYLPMGIAEGFADEIPSTIKEVDNAMGELNKGIQASVNPVINPTANTNPLILQIENFNNTRATDIQALAEELEFYRRNSALAVGGN